MTNWMDLKDFCKMAGFKYQTGRKWVIDGTIPGSIIPHGKKSKYLVDEKLAFEKIEKFRVN